MKVIKWFNLVQWFSSLITSSSNNNNIYWYFNGVNSLLEKGAQVCQKKTQKKNEENNNNNHNNINNINKYALSLFYNGQIMV